MPLWHKNDVFIAGRWRPARGIRLLPQYDPATEAPRPGVPAAAQEDVEDAVAAARAAFPAFSASPVEDRIALLHEIMALYLRRYDDIAAAMCWEIGAPMAFARDRQAAFGFAHLSKTVSVLRDHRFRRRQGSTLIVQEPIGVCALLTPWNWPVSQMLCKIAPALAAGCACVLKPSERAPMTAALLTEIVAEALENTGTPPGTFNLVQGDGETGALLATHPDVDMVSFTGSLRNGIAAAREAAGTVKRMTQELGGQSANIVLPDADIAAAVTEGAQRCFANAGQSCGAPARLLIPAGAQAAAVEAARAVAEGLRCGPPQAPETTLGPVISAERYAAVQALIASGVEEGARLAAGGPGRPEGIERGWFVKPTVFADVRAGMRIAREEIFGPVLCIIPYRDEDEAVAIANDTPYGLAAHVQSRDRHRAWRVGARLRVGSVHINYPVWDAGAPFGGYKQSGNGREYGEHGLEAFLETKAVLGWLPADGDGEKPLWSGYADDDADSAAA